MKNFGIAFLLVMLTGCSKDVAFKTGGNPGTPPGGNPPAPTNIQLHPDLVAGEDVSDKFQATPDGTKVVYIADQDQDGKNELYVSNPDGTGNLKLSPAMLNGRNVIDFKVAPNSLLVAYRADPNVAGAPDLFTVRLDGSNHHQVNAGSPALHQVFDSYKFMPNSLKIVYVTDENGAVNNRELIIANIDGTAKQKLNTVNPAFITFEIAPNGSRIVYRQETGVVGMVGPELKSCLPTGLGQVTLNDAFSHSSHGVTGMVISPNSTKVVYRTNLGHVSGAAYDLIAINIDGTGAKTKLNSTPVTNGSVSPTAHVEFEITADSQKAVYMADLDTDDEIELYASDLATGTASQIKLNGALASGGDVKKFKLSSNNRVVYIADELTDNLNELFSITNTGLSKLRLNSSMILGGRVAEVEISPDANFVVYAMDKTGSGFYNLVRQNIIGGVEINLHPALSGSAVGVYDITAPNSKQFMISPDSAKVVFRGSVDEANSQLYRVNSNGTGFEQINDDSGFSVPLRNSLGGSDFLILSDSSKAVYRLPDAISIRLFAGSL